MEVNLTKRVLTPNGRRYCSVVVGLCLARMSSGRKVGMFLRIDSKFGHDFSSESGVG